MQDPLASKDRIFFNKPTFPKACLQMLACNWHPLFITAVKHSHKLNSTARQNKSHWHLNSKLPLHTEQRITPFTGFQPCSIKQIFFLCLMKKIKSIFVQNGTENGTIN